MDYAHIEDKAILRLAQEVWRDEFGSARKSPAEPRFDLGRKRGCKQPGSETQWLQRRRESIIEGAASSGASSLDALSIDAIVVSDKQGKEIEFNMQKLLKKRAAAFSSGSLLPNEADDTVKAAVQESNKSKKGNTMKGSMKTRTARISSMRGRCALMS